MKLTTICDVSHVISYTRPRSKLSGVKRRVSLLPTLGYHKYYIVSTNTLQESSEFSVAEDASKAKIKSAFAKSLKTKKSNKKILGDFIGLIA